MPKKTKKEKLTAALRKRQRLLEMVAKPVIEKFPKKTEEVVVRDPSESRVNKQFTSDLKRSLILTLGIIALEIALYFGTISR